MAANSVTGKTLVSLVAELVANHVANATVVIRRWASIGWRCFVGYVALIFLLAATGFQDGALMVFCFVPLIAMGLAIFLVPGMALGVVAWPAIRDTRLGSLAGRVVQKLTRGVMGGGWCAFSLGNDVRDITRFQWSHPWLSFLLCVIAVPATVRDLSGEEDSGLLGVAAWILSGIVYGLDLIHYLSGKSQ